MADGSKLRLSEQSTPSRGPNLQVGEVEMDERELRRWRPDDVMRRNALRDGSWSAGEAAEAQRLRQWHELPLVHRSLLVVLAAALLVASGAGGVLALARRPLPSAGLYSVAARAAAHLPALLADRITRRIAPAVVDVSSLVITPQGMADVAGTGMLVSKTGLIVTNNHVVEEATRIWVTLPSEDLRYKARFLGADPVDDVAVLSIATGRRLPTVTLGDSRRLSVGAAVLAFGNSLGAGGLAARSHGSVTALRQQINATSETGADAEHLRGMIETDVPITPGESGGPLVDNRGRVVGMDTAALPASAALKVPLAFAIPARRVVRIIHDVVSGREGGGVVLGPPPYLGIEGTSTRYGVRVVGVEPATPAATAGLRPGDLLVSFDGRHVTTMDELAALIDRERPGRYVRLAYRSHRERLRTARVRIATGPDP